MSASEGHGWGEQHLELYLCHAGREVKGTYKSYHFSHHAGSKSETAGSDSRSLHNAKAAACCDVRARATSVCPSSPPATSVWCFQPGCGEEMHPLRLSCNSALAARAPHGPYWPHCCSRLTPQPWDGRRRLQSEVK